MRTIIQEPVSLPLFAQPVVKSRTLNHAEDWRRFRDSHPEVWERMVALALSKARRGLKFGIGSIFEILRWGADFSREGRLWKINNNWRAYAARDLVTAFPECGPCLELREVTVKDTLRPVRL